MINESDSSIPVICVAVITSSTWIKRLIDSIDYPVDNLAIFNNSGKEDITNELEKLVKIQHPYINKISLINFPNNIGLPAVWNLSIKCYINMPYWFFTNDDVSFTPGFLEAMFNATQDESVGIIHGGPGDLNDGAWDVFIIKDWVIQKIGLFDENFYPAYCEDIDYIMRIVNDDIPRVKGIGIPYYHGETTDYNISGQQTKKSNVEINNQLNYIQWFNQQHIIKKWGENWIMTNPYKFPFNNPNLPNNYTTFDLKFCREKYLKF
ncbi:hypothetical protein M0Q50_09240 [bacterium]|jgi:hypothetical protein|nr:hypothetical protein [bacterium]